MKFFVLLLLCISIARSENGVDVSTLVSVPQFQCLKNNGYNYAIVRGYRSIGQVDTNAAKTLQNAITAGLGHQTYLLPCMGKVSAQDQVEATIKELNPYVTKYWIDIESNPSATCTWSTDFQLNCNQLHKLVAAFVAHDIQPGIYSNYYYWNQTFGSVDACADFSSLQLWYIGLNDDKDFTNFKEFGGWTTPTIKQLTQNVKICGVTVDLDWNP